MKGLTSQYFKVLGRCIFEGWCGQFTTEIEIEIDKDRENYPLQKGPETGLCQESVVFFILQRRRIRLKAVCNSIPGPTLVVTEQTPIDDLQFVCYVKNTRKLS